MTRLLSQVLRQEPHALSRALRSDTPPLLDAAEREGVHVLVADILTRADPAGSHAPAFAAVVRQHTAEELLTRRELAHALDELRKVGIPALLFKGAPLGFTHYPYPAARPRLDADVLIANRDLAGASDALARWGYRAPLRIPGTLTRSQALFEKHDEHGVHHAVDLHWKVSKPQVFGDLFSMEELLARAVPIPALGPAALGPSPEDALAIACVHRVAHHPGDDRLIWLYDIHLLASRLDTQQSRAFLRLAEQKRIAGVCARGVATASGAFAPASPIAWQRALDDLAARHTDEPTAAYLGGRMRRVDVMLNDLGALPSWRLRLRLVAEHVFPPASYMYATYGVSRPWLLPVLYAWRAIRGAGAWFRPVRRTAKSKTHM